jgi:hypothetical protein
MGPKIAVWSVLVIFRKLLFFFKDLLLLRYHATFKQARGFSALYIKYVLYDENKKTATQIRLTRRIAFIGGAGLSLIALFR